MGIGLCHLREKLQNPTCEGETVSGGVGGGTKGERESNRLPVEQEGRLWA